jgi:hypothetical protein
MISDASRVTKRLDMAVVIGIDNYDQNDAFPPLEGPRKDAKAFITWLKTEYGDKPRLSDKQIFRQLKEATTSDITRLCTRVITEARSRAGDQEQAEPGRLYIFVAGHGYGSSIKDSMLYTSEASEYIPASFDLVRLADAFRYSGLFRDIILFVDCCRHMKRFPAPALPMNLPEAQEAATHFYCLGSIFGDPTIERQFGSSNHGVFSLHLLRALKGVEGNAIDHQGRVTAVTLMRHLLRKLESNGLASRPDFDPSDPNILRNLVLASGFDAPDRSLRVQLSYPDKGFTLFHGDGLGRLEWRREQLGSGLIRIHREDDCLLLIAAPEVDDIKLAERTTAVMNDQDYIRL